jgi:hypothetical protein
MTNSTAAISSAFVLVDALLMKNLMNGFRHFAFSVSVLDGWKHKEDHIPVEG